MRPEPSSNIIRSILISCALVLSYTYYYVVEKPLFADRYILHMQIIQGNAPSPYQYRVLIPFIADTFTHLFELILPMQYSFTLAYIILNVIAISLLLMSAYALLSCWYHWQYALIGTLFISSVVTLTYFEHYYQPWSFWEAAFYTLALYLMVNGQKGWLILVVTLAVLNRETGILILPAFFFTSVVGESMNRLDDYHKPELFWFLLYGIIGVVILLAVHLLRPADRSLETVTQIFANNIAISNLAKALLNWGLFLGIFWVFAIYGYPKAPIFFRRTILVFIIHIPLILIWGYWREVRMLIPHYIALIGLGLAVLPGSLQPMKS